MQPVLYTTRRLRTILLLSSIILAVVDGAMWENRNVINLKVLRSIGIGMMKRHANVR